MSFFNVRNASPNKRRLQALVGLALYPLIFALSVLVLLFKEGKEFFFTMLCMIYVIICGDGNDKLADLAGSRSDIMITFK